MPARLRCSATCATLFPDLDRATAAKADLATLGDPAEIDLIKLLAAFPKVANGAARAHEPHRLAFYLYELASALPPALVTWQ